MSDCPLRVRVEFRKERQYVALLELPKDLIREAQGFIKAFESLHN